jgi:hypothetical protein
MAKKHVSLATDMHATIEELLKAVFSMLSTLRLYSESRWEKLASHGLEVDTWTFEMMG